VLELKVPHGTDLPTLRPLLPVFLSYVLSFVYVAIYWNNHHHLLHTCHQVTARMMWANMHLLFWLSLIPAATHWMGETRFATWPAAVYGVLLLMSAVAYTVLSRLLVAKHGAESALAQAVGRDEKGKVSLLLYVAAIPLAFLDPRIACAIYVAVAILWLVPDRRIEKAMDHAA
jgi:uncharacterized membrane protein